jgi:hypothetical protein
MNIFVLDDDIKACAQAHANQHCVKMVVEYCQLMSTTHRVVDGVTRKIHMETKSGGIRKKLVNLLPGEGIDYPDDGGYEITNSKCYKETHENHPCAIWVRENSENYEWLALLTLELLDEYTHRYGRIHECSKVMEFLQNTPTKIKKASTRTPFALAMPDEYRVPGNAVQSYRNFYNHDKSSFAKWSKREAPTWFQNLHQ